MVSLSHNELIKIWQAITWANFDPDPCCQMASLGLTELNTIIDRYRYQKYVYLKWLINSKVSKLFANQSVAKPKLVAKILATIMVYRASSHNSIFMSAWSSPVNNKLKNQNGTHRLIAFDWNQLLLKLYMYCLLCWPISHDPQPRPRSYVCSVKN